MKQNVSHSNKIHSESSLKAQQHDIFLVENFQSTNTLSLGIFGISDFPTILQESKIGRLPYMGSLRGKKNQ